MKGAEIVRCYSIGYILFLCGIKILISSPKVQCAHTIQILTGHTISGRADLCIQKICWEWSLKKRLLDNGGGSLQLIVASGSHQKRGWKLHGCTSIPVFILFLITLVIVFVLWLLFPWWTIYALNREVTGNSTLRQESEKPTKTRFDGTQLSTSLLTWINYVLSTSSS